MAILLRTNDALTTNPPSGDNSLSVNGSNWLWAVTAIYVVFFLGFVAHSFAARAGEKIFHHIFTIALFVGSITYFAQASDLGWSLVSQINVQEYGLTRQIFFAKYINWVVAFPSVIIALGLLSGVAWASIFFNVFLSWVWVISYLVSAYTQTNYKWGFFAFGTVAWILLAVNTLALGSTSARRVEVSRDHTLLAGWVNLLWLLYPIAFGLSDGGNRIGVTSHFIFLASSTCSWYRCCPLPFWCSRVTGTTTASTLPLRSTAASTRAETFPKRTLRRVVDPSLAELLLESSRRALERRLSLRGCRATEWRTPEEKGWRQRHGYRHTHLCCRLLRVWSA